MCAQTISCERSAATFERQREISDVKPRFNVCLFSFRGLSRKALKLDKTLTQRAVICHGKAYFMRISVIKISAKRDGASVTSTIRFAKC